MQCGKFRGRAHSLQMFQIDLIVLPGKYAPNCAAPDVGTRKLRQPQGIKNAIAYFQVYYTPRVKLVEEVLLTFVCTSKCTQNSTNPKNAPSTLLSMSRVEQELGSNLQLCM